METLRCSHCKFDLPIDQFWKNNSTTRKYSYLCKECMNKHYKGRDTEAYNKWAKEYRKRQVSKEYEQSFRKKYLCSFPGHVCKLLSSAKARSLKKGLECSIDNDWVREKLTPMICSVTKLPLSFNKYKEQTYRVNPYSPSLDRIDPTKGYTKENTRIVCWIYNVAKSDFSDEDLLILAKAVVENTKP